MNLKKAESIVSDEWLWQFEDGDRDINVFDAPVKTHLLFGIFHLDRLSDKNVDIQLKKIYKQATEAFRSWNLKYPWSEYNPVNIKIQQVEDNNSYILGQICVEDNVIEEEQLIIAILQYLSSKLTVNEFIRVTDSNGDFLLSECHDSIPKEYEYPISNNRLWLHEGKFKLIPNSFYYNRGLEPREALEFLKKAYFRCIEVNEISKRIYKTMIKGFPDDNLSKLVKLPLELEDTYLLNLISTNPQVVSYLLKQLLRESVEISKNKSRTENPVLEVLVPTDFSNLLSIYMDSKSLKKYPHRIPLYSGRIVSKLLELAIADGVLIPNDYALNNVSDIDDGLFDTYKFETISLSSPVDFSSDYEPNQDFMDKLPEYLKNVTKDIKNMNMEKTTFLDDQLLDSDSESLPDSRDEIPITQDDENNEGKEYFKENNIDIDEDDFFEFFLKEALKMKDKDVESYAKQSNTPSNKSRSTEEFNDSYFDELDETLRNFNIKEDSTKYAEELINSMAVDGAPNELLESLFRNISGDK